MMETLFLRIPPEGGPSPDLEWALYRGRDRLSGGAVGVGVPLPITAASGRRHVIALVPGACVLLTEARLPPRQHRHLKKLLPNLVEDTLAEDIDRLHLAASPSHQSDALPVAAANRKLMGEWVQTLQAAGIAPHVLVPETLAVPHHSDGWSLVCDGRTAWLRTGRAQGFTVEYDLLPPLITALLASNLSMRCDLYATGPEASDGTLLDHLTLEFPTLAIRNCACPADPTALFFGELAEEEAPFLPPVNLLQGEFPPEPASPVSVRVWQSVALVAVIGVLLQILLNGAESWYLARQSRHLQDDMAATYRSLFPADTKIIDPVQQMKAHVSDGLSGETHGFLPLLRQLAAVWPGAGGDLQMQNLTYQEEQHSLTLHLTAPSSGAMNRLAQALNRAGLSAKLLSVVTSGGTVQGQLAVSEGNL